MSSTEEIKARIDIVDLVSEAGVQLRKSGSSYSGFCPFHDNKRTPAFVVWPESGIWKCYGQCNEGGDIFKFVMKKNGWDFKEALQHLAARAGVELQQYTPRQEAQKEVYDSLRDLLEEAVLFYHNHLLSNPDVLHYLHEKRGLTDATIETFGLGYAPQGWDNALTHFTARGHSEQELLEVGLLSERDSGGYYDKFRHRLMIPIRDARGRMTGFGARALDDEQIPKYLNSPQTVLFDKGRLLYGLDRARKAIREADQVVIVEGYLDVIAPHQAGFENVVSPMGTALTEDQLRLLKRYTRKIVLALDPDAAGQKAVLRGLDAARQAMSKTIETNIGQGDIKRFDAPDLVRFSYRIDADIRVANLPDGLDPDEIVARDPDEWVHLIENAKPVIEHVMETLAQGQDLGDRAVISDIAEQVLPLIQDLPKPTDREYFTQKLARFLRIDERAFIGQQARGPVVRRTKRRPAEKTQQPVEIVPVVKAVSPSYKMELYCLGALFRKPELLHRLDRNLQQTGLSRLLNEDFEYTDHQELLDFIRASLEQDKVDHHEYVVENLPETLKELTGELLQHSQELDPVDERLLEELQRTIIKLRRMGLNESLNQLRFMLEDAQQQGDFKATSFQTQVLQHTKLLRDLDQAGRKLSARRLE